MNKNPSFIPHLFTIGVFFSVHSRESGTLRFHSAPKHGGKDACAGPKRRDEQRAL